ncbi:MAG: carboxypeptidase-like regulatory domain-containing protein, partial [Bacteroidota bacterium]|nr:carboxypeptidase-like regulatory domain-containing protein [Bacteroidota bacterium]
MKYGVSIVFALCISINAIGQKAFIKGRVTDPGAAPLPYAVVMLDGTGYTDMADSAGYFNIDNIEPGDYTLIAQYIDYRNTEKTLHLVRGKTLDVSIVMEPEENAEPVTITGRRITDGIIRMNAVEGVGIYEGKKNEVIVLDDINANLATNNTRQIFAKVPGVNIIENDGGGVQIGVAVRGLNPNRISEFNSRQNGYDISADALGYPESYYTPPAEGLDRIEVVRGAASLQYGSQFGGLMNFVFKKGPADKPFEFTARQTIGSYGHWNSFTSIGGTHKRVSYYAFVHHKQADGWRDNSAFSINTGYASMQYKASKRLVLGTEFTAMRYNMQQAGGLTDAQFAINPRMA